MRRLLGDVSGETFPDLKPANIILPLRASIH